jgi:hypothetical protein
MPGRNQRQRMNPNAMGRGQMMEDDFGLDFDPDTRGAFVDNFGGGDDFDDGDLFDGPPPGAGSRPRRAFGGRNPPMRDFGEDANFMGRGHSGMDDIDGIAGGGIRPRPPARRGTGQPRKPKRDRGPGRRGRDFGDPAFMMSGANGLGNGESAWEDIADDGPHVFDDCKFDATPPKPRTFLSLKQTEN